MVITAASNAFSSSAVTQADEGLLCMINLPEMEAYESLFEDTRNLAEFLQ